MVQLAVTCLVDDPEPAVSQHPFDRGHGVRIPAGEGVGVIAPPILHRSRIDPESALKRLSAGDWSYPVAAV